MHSVAHTKIKRHLVCFAVSQQSVCIKSFPVAFLEHKTFAQALMLSIVSLQKVRPDWCRVSQSEVGIFKTVFPNLNLKHNILYSWAGEDYMGSALKPVASARSPLWSRLKQRFSQKNIGRSVVQFCTNIHGPWRQDPQTFPLEPQWGWHL